MRFAATVYLYGDAGLHELLFESDVFVKGGVLQILNGKDFERALRDSNLWMKHQIIYSFFSSNVGVRRMAKSTLKTLTK